MLQQHVDPRLDRPFGVGAGGDAEDQVTFALAEIGGDEATIDALRVVEVERAGHPGLQHREEITQVGEIFEEPEGAAVMELTQDFEAGGAGIACGLIQAAGRPG
jgi:hypothetical protein